MPHAPARYRRLFEIALLKAALQLLRPLEALLEQCSRWLSGERDNSSLQLGQAVYRCYMQERTSLQMQKLTAAYQLHLMRDELVACVRENRQLKGRLQMYEYEEDAAEVTRDSLLGLHREKSDLSERNGQLISELSRTQSLLEFVEHDIEEHPTRHPTRRKGMQMGSNSLNNECSCSFDKEDPAFSETGTVKVYSSFSTESFDSDCSAWISKHEIIVHLSSSFPPKQD